MVPRVHVRHSGSRSRTARIVFGLVALAGLAAALALTGCGASLRHAGDVEASADVDTGESSGSCRRNGASALLAPHVARAPSTARASDSERTASAAHMIEGARPRFARRSKRATRARHGRAAAGLHVKRVGICADDAGSWIGGRSSLLATSTAARGRWRESCASRQRTLKAADFVHRGRTQGTRLPRSHATEPDRGVHAAWRSAEPGRCARHRPRGDGRLHQRRGGSGAAGLPEVRLDCHADADRRSNCCRCSRRSAETAGPAPQYIFEPDAETIFAELLPRYVETLIYQPLLETVASFYSAQMVAMRNATDNANDLLDDLTLTYNKARQAAITTQILEIVAGSGCRTCAQPARAQEHENDQWLPPRPHAQGHVTAGARQRRRRRVPARQAARDLQRPRDADSRPGSSAGRSRSSSCSATTSCAASAWGRPTACSAARPPTTPARHHRAGRPGDAGAHLQRSGPAD